MPGSAPRSHWFESPASALAAAVDLRRSLRRASADPVTAWKAFHSAPVGPSRKHGQGLAAGPRTDRAAQRGGHPRIDMAAYAALRDALPAPQWRALSHLLHAIHRAQATAERTVRGDPAWMATANAIEAEAPTATELAHLRTAIARYDKTQAAARMGELLAAARAVASSFQSLPSDHPGSRLRLSSPLGEIVIDTTANDDAFVGQRPLLLIDRAGNDRYLFTGTPERQAVSVLIDLQGHDHYTATADHACPAAAWFGFGLLWDAAGDDVYHAARIAQAAAVFGAAVLVDGDGDDEYGLDDLGQGAALVGSAMLFDRRGNDRYQAAHRAQGFAGPHGRALVLDADGDDRYRMRDDALRHPSPQDPGSNLSLGQGTGAGWRDDSGQLLLAGGLGVLFDVAGDDHYAAEVFAQASGFGSGIGLLFDDAGNDHRQAVWYAQAAAAHGASAVLLDATGEDRYETRRSTGLAAAHDDSVAVLVDADGSDRFHLSTFGLGAATFGSRALFIDQRGDDRYHVADQLCRALGTTVLEDFKPGDHGTTSLGYFVDQDGDDAYPAHCPARGNARHWRANSDALGARAPGAWGMGLDRDVAGAPTR